MNEKKELLREYFNLTVKPTVEEFLHAPHDLRRGRIASIILHHTNDYIKNALPDFISISEKYRNKNEVTEKLNVLFREANPHHDLIKDIADATKHATLHKKTRDVSEADQVSRLPNIFEAPFGEGYFADQIVVVVNLNGGVIKSLPEIIAEATTQLETYLQGKGVL